MPGNGGEWENPHRADQQPVGKQGHIETSLSPLELLDELQAIEQRMGRVKLIDKGPRNIDLDILLFGETQHADDRLQIPHALMFEREFVLRPLSELIPQDNTLALPFEHSHIHERLASLPKPDAPLVPLVPLSPSLSPMSSALTHPATRIMSILNVTPDSFSDGGQNYQRDPETLRGTITAHIDAGATIIDVGGQSTRPGAREVSEEEELARVLPAIKLIRSIPQAHGIAISVDTYRASVAEQAIAAGANMINDVSAGAMDDAMLGTMAKLGCTVCLMHMRGTPTTMTTPALTSYPDGIVETVGRELRDCLRAAQNAGVRRWRIMLDPGIGFAKTRDHNLDLLRRQCELASYPGLERLPWLVGTSRKAFIGHVTGVKDAQERVWGTAVAVSAAIQGGADIVRVHDVKAMAQVAKMADALWRHGS
ncbi:trifunctional dihydropteroate synthetase [Exserohilum turcicum]